MLHVKPVRQRRVPIRVSVCAMIVLAALLIT